VVKLLKDKLKATPLYRQKTESGVTRPFPGTTLSEVRVLLSPGWTAILIGSAPSWLNLIKATSAGARSRRAPVEYWVPNRDL